MVQQRHLTVCANSGRPPCSTPFFPLDRGPAPLKNIWQQHAPSWQELAAGVRPEQLLWDGDMEPGPSRHGNAEPQNPSMGFSWRAPSDSDSLRQSRSCLDRKEVFWRLSPSCAFPLPIFPGWIPPSFACCSFVAFGFPSPPSSRFCRCGRPLDASGHHRESCAQVLPLWCVGKQVLASPPTCW